MAGGNKVQVQHTTPRRGPSLYMGEESGRVFISRKEPLTESLLAKVEPEVRWVVITPSEGFRRLSDALMGKLAEYPEIISSVVPTGPHDELHAGSHSTRGVIGVIEAFQMHTMEGEARKGGQTGMVTLSDDEAGRRVPYLMKITLTPERQADVELLLDAVFSAARLCLSEQPDLHIAISEKMSLPAFPPAPKPAAPETSK